MEKNPRHTTTPLTERCKHGMIKDWCGLCNPQRRDKTVDLMASIIDDDEDDDEDNDEDQGDWEPMEDYRRNNPDADVDSRDSDNDHFLDDMSVLDLIELFELWDNEDIDEDIYASN